jgi:predicted  nucleic acid-binding Zn-ribbon protein
VGFVQASAVHYLLLAVVLASSGAFAAETSAPRTSSSPAPSTGGARTVAEIQAAYDKTHTTLERDHKHNISELQKQIEELDRQIRQLKEQMDKLKVAMARTEELLPKVMQMVGSDPAARSRADTMREENKARAKELQNAERKSDELKKKLAVLNREKETLAAQFQQAVRQEREQALKNARR